MNLADYREDTTKQNDGAPIKVGDAVFYVRRFGTPESQQQLKDIRLSIFGPFHGEDENEEDKLLAHWLVEYGVVFWRGVFNEDGSSLAYTEANARKVLLNPEYFQSLNRLLYSGSLNFENYLYDKAKKDAEEVKKP